jgi:hypothetical protein
MADAPDMAIGSLAVFGGPATGCSTMQIESALRVDDARR